MHVILNISNTTQAKQMALKNIIHTTQHTDVSESDVIAKE